MKDNASNNYQKLVKIAAFQQKGMAIAALIFLTLFNLLTAGARTKLQWVQDSSVNHEDGICKSMVETQGYRCEDHKVTTKDGYILSMQRILTGRFGGNRKKVKPPVVLQHGLLSDASTWLWNSPNESLGFIMADNGFDVWLTNVRGTYYSREHTSLSPNDLAYWDWSWDELVAYDLPATLQYVHDRTGKKLHYVGHSLGTLMAFGAFSRDKKVLNLVKSAALLSPIAYMSQMPSPLARAAADAFLGEVIYWLGVKEFALGGFMNTTNGFYARVLKLPKEFWSIIKRRWKVRAGFQNQSNGPFSKLMDEICIIEMNNCRDLMSLFTGSNCCLNSSKSYLDHVEPTATKNMVHLAQMIRRGNLAMYDYGCEDKNNEHYGQSTPPDYNMKNIPNDLPLLLAYGGKDMLSDVKDVRALLDSLVEHDQDKLMVLYQEDYSHLDFVVGVNAKEVVYNQVMAFFKLNQ